MKQADQQPGRREMWYLRSGSPPKIYLRSDFLKIMHVAKPATQQVACLLMMRMGLRTGEVIHLKHADVDVDYLVPRRSVVRVFDSKDKRYYPLPMNRDVLGAYLQLKDQEGYVLQRDAHFTKYRGRPVTKEALNYMVTRWAYDAGVHSPAQFSPRSFRRFFAKEWVRPRMINGQLRKGSVKSLSKVMRHHNPFTTWVYINSITYTEEMQEEMDLLYGDPGPESAVEQAPRQPWVTGAHAPYRRRRSR